VGLQIGMGFARRLGVHVPLGVAIVTASVLLTAWVWAPTARRARVARPPGPGVGSAQPGGGDPARSDQAGSPARSEGGP